MTCRYADRTKAIMDSYREKKEAWFSLKISKHQNQTFWAADPKLMFGLQEGVPKVVIAIYLEAEDFEAMKKVGAVQPWPQTWAQCNSKKCFEMLSRLIKWR